MNNKCFLSTENRAFILECGKSNINYACTISEYMLEVKIDGLTHAWPSISNSIYLNKKIVLLKHRIISLKKVLRKVVEGCYASNVLMAFQL